MRGGHDSNEQAEADLRAFGAPQDMIDALPIMSVDFEVEPDDWDTVQMWMRVQTQWRAGFGGFFGLDYVAVDVVMRRLGMADEDGTIFAGLQVMEHAALRARAKA